MSAAGPSPATGAANRGDGTRLADVRDMPEILVNDVRQEFDAPPATWGDLLDSLDAQAAHEGLVLSAARFDGVEEPAFRAPAITGRALVGIGRVEVETAVPAIFLRNCLRDSIQPLQETADTALVLAALYRGNDLSRGHEGLAELAATLGSLTMLVAMLSGPLGIDLSAVSGDGLTATQQIEQLGTTLDALVSAQTSQDWLTVADILEYDLEPAIRRWASILTLLTGNQE